jgi:hypothetical protein
MRNLARWNRRIKPLLAACLTSATLSLGGCWDSDLAKRFREGYAPGFITGLSTALGQVGQAETGLRQMGTALAQGLGSLLQPRTSVSSGSSGSSGSSSSG